MARVKIITELPIEDTAFICVMIEDGKLEKVGDITLMANGHVVVMNDWRGDLSFFDTYEDALWYVRGRMCGADPIYAM